MVVDLIGHSSYSFHMYLPDLKLCLQDGLTHTEHSRSFKLTNRCVGELAVTSGEILATDPFAPMDQAPFSRRVTAGIYPVVLTHATDSTADTVAFARIEFSKRPVVRWEMALRAGEDTADLSAGEGFGYAVDTGTGCFMDVDQFHDYDEKLAADESFGRTLIEKFYDGDGALDYASQGSTPGNIIMFRSGLGDGVYSSYWGFDELGEAVALVTSFGVVGAAVAPSSASRPGSRSWWQIWKK